MQLYWRHSRKKITFYTEHKHEIIYWTFGEVVSILCQQETLCIYYSLGCGIFNNE